MEIVVQRVKNAVVKVSQKEIGRIGKGLVIFLGIAEGDTREDADWMIEKVINLRIFPGDGKNMNKSVREIGGALLVVSQFTLLGNCNKGRRPSFNDAASSEEAEKLYDYFVDKVKTTELKISTGEFKKEMQINLVNDGPVTFSISTSKE